MITAFVSCSPPPPFFAGHPVAHLTPPARPPPTSMYRKIRLKQLHYDDGLNSLPGGAGIERKGSWAWLRCPVLCSVQHSGAIISFSHPTRRLGRRLSLCLAESGYDMHNILFIAVSEKEEASLPVAIYDCKKFLLPQCSVRIRYSSIVFWGRGIISSDPHV